MQRFIWGNRHSSSQLPPRCLSVPPGAASILVQVATAAALTSRPLDLQSEASRNNRGRPVVQPNLLPEIWRPSGANSLAEAAIAARRASRGWRPSAEAELPKHGTLGLREEHLNCGDLRIPPEDLTSRPSRRYQPSAVRLVTSMPANASCSSKPPCRQASKAAHSRSESRSSCM